jgi:calcineurin-like phosphoesterase family protein
MRIHYMSDVHLEFGALDKPLPEGDVVVLAGDITLLAALDPDKADPRARRVREATHSFFEAVAKSFRKVIYLMGNHEHYGFCIDDSAEAVRRYLPGVTLLENEHLVLGDTILCGATLWTDMGGGDPLKEQAVQRGMSDFYVIEKRDGDQTRAFRPADARALFVASLAYIEGLADAHRDKKLVVATHHAPSRLGVAPSQRTSRINPAYFTDLTAFIEDRPNIGVWIHGHTHVQIEYTIGGCRVLSNARGYAGREPAAARFDPDRWFEI